jgi:hypothetical protein
MPVASQESSFHTAWSRSVSWAGSNLVGRNIDPLKFCEILDAKKMPMFSSPIVYDQGLQNKILDISGYSSQRYG